ncbi:hypothetical protein PYCC9005_005528 [Savitreella phatthalungensis]
MSSKDARGVGADHQHHPADPDIQDHPQTIPIRTPPGMRPPWQPPIRSEQHAQPHPHSSSHAHPHQHAQQHSFPPGPPEAFDYRAQMKPPQPYMMPYNTYAPFHPQQVYQSGRPFPPQNPPVPLAPHHRPMNRPQNFPHTHEAKPSSDYGGASTTPSTYGDHRHVSPQHASKRKRVDPRNHANRHQSSHNHHPHGHHHHHDVSRTGQELVLSGRQVNHVSPASERSFGRPPNSRPTVPQDASRHPQARRTFSDFRLKAVYCGSWTSDEGSQSDETVSGGARDSRVRFCFRKASDRGPDARLSAADAALIHPDRLSISHSRGTRRIVIPTHHISRIDFLRASGRIVIATDGWAAFEELVPADDAPSLLRPDRTGGSERSDRSGATTTTVAAATSATGSISTPTWRSAHDPTGGQLSSHRTITLELDLDRPLTEPKWTRASPDELRNLIDPASRFVDILHVRERSADAAEDCEPGDRPGALSLEAVVDEWAGDDADRGFFGDVELPTRMAEVFATLFPSSASLSRAVRTLAAGVTDTALISRALSFAPRTQLIRALETTYRAFQAQQDANTAATSAGATTVAHAIISHHPSAPAAGKRQRGESEVPSEQLSKASLEEKRRRLSPSRVHHPGGSSSLSTCDRTVGKRKPSATDADVEARVAGMSLTHKPPPPLRHSTRQPIVARAVEDESASHRPRSRSAPAKAASAPSSVTAARTSQQIESKQGESSSQGLVSKLDRHVRAQQAADKRSQSAPALRSDAGSEYGEDDSNGEGEDEEEEEEEEEEDDEEEEEEYDEDAQLQASGEEDNPQDDLPVPVPAPVHVHVHPRTLRRG